MEAFGTWKPLSLTYPTKKFAKLWWCALLCFLSFVLFCFVFFLVSLSHAEHNLGVEKSNPNKALLYNTKVQGHGGPPSSQSLFFSFNFLLCAWVVLCLYGRKTRWEGGQVHIWFSVAYSPCLPLARPENCLAWAHPAPFLVLCWMTAGRSNGWDDPQAAIFPNSS